MAEDYTVITGEEESKGTNIWLIVLIVVLVVMFCCCASLVISLIFMGGIVSEVFNEIVNQLGTSTY